MSNRSFVGGVKVIDENRKLKFSDVRSQLEF